ncbi:hypothetical protein CLDAP_06150 [Caldilinea aerophila DSM 14535 = NBRC 104270]|uniref:Uncharacterized protein n=1 Tax=Caldilinea aerophila (strain DSM 14535 / JCM 11387 / NBRC 104270 / STL-6-O1) TaxID=926550 RepID=I0I067_CALAS|nr:hypothetical protein CLDAP_06150 [Caldilinea aerophila DSM 14535 = NBRC 104270]
MQFINQAFILTGCSQSHILTSVQKLPAEMPQGRGRQCLPLPLRLGVDFLQWIHILVY